MKARYNCPHCEEWVDALVHPGLSRVECPKCKGGFHPSLGSEPRSDGGIDIGAAMARQRVLRNQIGECSAYYTVRSLARLVMIMVGLAAVVAVFWLFQRDRWMEMWIVSIVAFAFEVLFYALTIVVCDIADAHLLMRDELRLRQDFATKV